MTKTGRRKKMRKHLGSFVIMGVVVVMICFVSIASLNLRVQNAGKQEYIGKLENRIAEEEERSKEIEEYGKYVQTKRFVEKVAKEKLGLVYEDEIIFRAEN